MFGFDSRSIGWLSIVILTYGSSIFMWNCKSYDVKKRRQYEKEENFSQKPTYKTELCVRSRHYDNTLNTCQFLGRVSHASLSTLRLPYY